MKIMYVVINFLCVGKCQPNSQTSQSVDNHVLEEEARHPSLGLHHHINLGLALRNVVFLHLCSLKYVKFGNAIFGCIHSPGSSVEKLANCRGFSRWLGFLKCLPEVA